MALGVTPPPSGGAATEFDGRAGPKENRAAERAEPEAVGGEGGHRDLLPCQKGIVNTLSVVLKRTWIDWAVLVCMAVTAARCRSPFLVVLFTALALAVAVIATRKTRQILRALQDGGTPRRSRW